jgi:signal transduction histidine kinase
MEGGRFTHVASVPEGYTHGIDEDRTGGVWILHQEKGLLRLVNEKVVETFSWDLFSSGSASSLVCDRSQGGLWLGFPQGRIVRFKDGHILNSYTIEGSVNDIRMGPDGIIWASTENGLWRLKESHLSKLGAQNGLPCPSIRWTLNDDADASWLYTSCGLLRIDHTDLDDWVADFKRKIKFTFFDASDGIRGRVTPGAYKPLASKAPDGKLWLVTPDGVSIIDPRHLGLNSIVPPVHIEQIEVDRRTFESKPHLRLPALSRDFRIDYTALSFVSPEKIRFRYKLEGHDRDWTDAGNRRQAFYNDLAPRKYRFRVMAANNSGVWNEAGASFEFSVNPALYQTLWFQALCVVTAGLLTWALYRLRLRQMSALYNERLAERTRIARDLHDGLLQSLAGVSLQLHGIAKTAAATPEKTPPQIEKIRQQVDAAFREARSKVYNLRSPAVEGKGLTEALGDFIERLGPTATARYTLHVTGEPLFCTPEIREELLRIAEEAANNANRHAGAKEIRIAVEYSGKSLKLSISDDGAGFHLEEGLAKTGHWGLKNMQERATQLRGKCSITSAPGQGTKIEVQVPLRRWSLRKNLAK